MHILLYQQAVSEKGDHINKYHSLDFVVFTRDDRRRVRVYPVDNMQVNLLMELCAVTYSKSRRSVFLHALRAGTPESESLCVESLACPEAAKFDAMVKGTFC